MGMVPLLAILGVVNARSPLIERRAACNAFGGALIAQVLPKPCSASEPRKLRGLSDEQLKKKLLLDIVDHRFMVSGRLSPELYSEDAKFTDEIDTYSIDQYMTGTSKLFDAERSDFKLVGDLLFEGNKISYRFDEILSFRIPLQPRSRVSGRVELLRDDDGLIKTYREFWDQSVPATIFDLVLDGIGVKRASFAEEAKASM